MMLCRTHLIAFMQTVPKCCSLIKLSRWYVVHVTANGNPLLLMQLHAKRIQQIQRTLSMMMMGNSIIPCQMGSADVMEQCYNTATLF